MVGIVTKLVEELDRFSDRDRSAQLYYTFEPHIKNLVGAADLDYVLPTTFLPIIGGRPHTNDVEGVIVSAIDSSIGEAVTDEKISEVISACKDFLDQAHSSVDLKPSEIMMDGMKLRFRLASKDNPDGATRCVIVTRARWLTEQLGSGTRGFH